MTSFAEKTLGELVGDASKADLLTTLCSFFENMGSIRRSADCLAVHENTIRYRLTRIEELTGLAVMHDPDAQLRRGCRCWRCICREGCRPRPQPAPGQPARRIGPLWGNAQRCARRGRTSGTDLMSSAVREVHVLGVGATSFARTGRSGDELAREAITAALADAGVGLREVPAFTLARGNGRTAASDSHLFGVGSGRPLPPVCVRVRPRSTWAGSPWRAACTTWCCAWVASLRTRTATARGGAGSMSSRELPATTCARPARPRSSSRASWRRIAPTAPRIRGRS